MKYIAGKLLSRKSCGFLMILMLGFMLMISACSSSTTPTDEVFPTQLSIEKLANSRIKLTWQYDAAGSDTLFFGVSRRIGISGWVDNYAVLGSDIHELIDYIPTTDSIAYAYRVNCTNVTQGYTSPFSEVIAYLSEYTYPTDLSFDQISQDRIEISWRDHCVGEDGFIVDRKLNDDNWEEGYLYLPPDAEMITDIVELFDNINYRIYAFVGASRTAYLSDTLFTTLSAPASLVTATLDVNKIRLNWHDMSEGEDGFIIDRKIGSLPWQVDYASVSANDSTYVDDITLPCATLQYRVKAYKEDFYSPWSNISTINVQLGLIGSYNTTGNALDVFLPADNMYIPEWTAFISDNYQGLAVLDCQNPTSPQLQVVYQNLWGDRTLTSFVAGNFAYVATQSLATAAGGIQKMDITNLENPIIFSVTETNGIPKDLYVDGDYAYVAEGENGLSLMYIASSTPVFISSVELYDARSVFIYEDAGSIYACVANGLNRGLEIIDVTDPQSPVTVASLPLEGIACDVMVCDGIAWLANGEEGLAAIDLSDVSNPQLLNQISTGGFVNGVYAEENYVYISDLEEGFFVVDSSSPLDAYILGGLVLEGQPNSVQLSGSYVYMTDNESLKIIKVKP
ncbi:MAG: hypothetical protein K9N06_08585 [Candidatus Cloacimonetes bacterium]|nr:hypothetical protein [Candidatus Cloacimonadota bacterium]